MHHRAQIVPYSATPAAELRSTNYCCPLCQRPFVSRELPFPPQYFRTLSFQTGEGSPDVEADEAILYETAGYYAKYFVETQKLGHGSYGGVYVCRHVVEGVSLGLFAVKKIPIGDDIEYFRKVIEEVRMLEEVRRHPNVIEYNHSWIDYAQVADFGPVIRCLFILMEYATEGPLDVFLKKHGEVLSDKAVWYFFLSAVAGLAHLHSKGIIHRDLKPQNLLLTWCEGRPPRLVLSDFGTASLIAFEEQRSETGFTGTKEYTAPELLSAEVGGRKLTKASDMWSMGMILHYLAFECTLPEMNPFAISTIRARPPYMNGLIQALLSEDPDARPTCDKILRLPFVQTFLAVVESGRWNDIGEPAPVPPPLLLWQDFQLHSSLTRKQSTRSFSPPPMSMSPVTPAMASSKVFPVNPKTDLPVAQSPRWAVPVKALVVAVWCLVHGALIAFVQA